MMRDFRLEGQFYDGKRKNEFPSMKGLRQKYSSVTRQLGSLLKARLADEVSSVRGQIGPIYTGHLIQKKLKYSTLIIHS